MALPSPAGCALAVLGVAGLYVFQGEIWRLIVHALGESHLRARPARAIWGKSLLARYVPTNALMVVGRMVMAEKEGVPKRVTLASIAYELVLGFGTAVMVGAYFVIQLPDLEDQPARYAVLAADPDRARRSSTRACSGRSRTSASASSAASRCPQVLSFGQVLKFSLMYIGCWARDRRGRVRLRQGAHAAAGLGLPLRGRRVSGGVLRRGAHLHRAERPRHARRRAGRGASRPCWTTRWPRPSPWASASSRP